MKLTAIAVALLTVLTLPGCIARAVVDVATAPVKVAGKAVDLATTSQAEADQKRGRELRQREERLGKLERDYAKQARKCADGNDDACVRRDVLANEIDALTPTIPAESR